MNVMMENVKWRNKLVKAPSNANEAHAALMKYVAADAIVIVNAMTGRICELAV